jgi:monoamine oxidase
VRDEADVAIVGAGLAGLSAAAAVTEGGRQALVLEARDRVGGRVLNHDLGGGHVVELGGQWLGPTQDRMYALVGELGLETFPTYDTGDRVALIGRRRHRFSGALPRLNPLVLADLAQAFAGLERAARRIPPDRPWDAPGARALDGQTLETWIRRRVRTRTAREALTLFMETVLTTDAATISLLFALYYIRSGTSLENQAATTGGAQQDRLVGGSQVIPLRMAERLGDAVRLGAPVRRIEDAGAGVRVVGDGVEVRAGRAIVAVPPTLAGRIAYDPPLPGWRDQLTQRVPHGATIKANAVYDEPFWRDRGLSGQAASTHLAVAFTFDNSPPEASAGVLVAFVEAEHARQLGRASQQTRRKVILDCLADYFGPRAADPRDYVERDWTEEEWTRGCFGGHMPPGVLTRYGPALREPVGRIHWAGTESARIWTGYMEGAVESGRRAAAEVLSALDG